MGNGLSGILVDDSWLEVILPWFPVTFLVMLIRTVSRWLYEMERGTWENGIQRSREKKIDFRKCSRFVIRILLWGIGLFFLRKALIPYSPELAAGQMVRFLFLACEAPENNGAFRWYIMFPKTMAQAERLMSGIGCIIKCGAAALLIGAV